MELGFAATYIIAITVAFAWVTSKAIFWLWWMIGEPVSDGNTAMWAKGRIFSFYGKWVCSKYNDFEQKNANRMQRLMDQHSGNAKMIKQILDKPYVNPFKAMGVCVICFGFHLSYLTCIFLLLYFSIFICSLWWSAMALIFAFFPALTLTFLQGSVKHYFE